MPSNFKAEFLRELHSGLHALEARGQRRSLREIRGVNLCSNDYLGLAEHPALREAVSDAVRESSRISGTGSRLLSGHCAAWEEIEEEFAGFAGTEAALYFGSGYAANLGLLTSLLDKRDLVFSDEFNHASLVDGIRLSGARKVVYTHLDANAVESALRQHANDAGRKLIVTESVFSMDGDVAPIRELLGIADRFGAGVIVDEAHATAMHGPSGMGIAAAIEDVGDPLAIVHTCGKALASVGAFVCGNAVLKDHLINHARSFIFSTAMPPYMAVQIRTALKLSLAMDGAREELRSRARCMTASLEAQGWNTAGSTTQIVPVVIGGNEEALAAAEFLQRESFAVRAIRPPTVPEGTARLRFSLTCAIPQQELIRLDDTLNAWREQRCMHASAGRA
jgi:8-amino-7-oxononanoate synthase